MYLWVVTQKNRSYLDIVHQHRHRGHNLMKWFRLHCWCSLLGTAHSQCRKHNRAVSLRCHGHSGHLQLVWLLWHVAADMITLFSWCSIQPIVYSNSIYSILNYLQQSYQAQGIPAACRPHQRLGYPKSCHRQYPINRWDKSPLFLLSDHLPTVSDPLCSWLELQAQTLCKTLLWKFSQSGSFMQPYLNTWPPHHHCGHRYGLQCQGLSSWGVKTQFLCIQHCSERSLHCLYQSKHCCRL